MKANELLKEELLEEFLDRFSSEDLDPHVHEIMSLKATNINNKGIEAQFEFLYKNAGLAWLEQLLLG